MVALEDLQPYLPLPGAYLGPQGMRYDVFIRMSLLEGWKHLTSYYNASLALACQNFIRDQHRDMQVKTERKPR